MKNPVLKIRKGVDVYDDTAPSRPTARFDDAPAPRRRRGRMGRLLFLPLLVLALAVGAFVTLSHSPRTARFPGWDVRLEAATDGDLLLVAFTFTSRGAPAPVGGTDASAAPRAKVHVVLPDSGATVDLSGALAAPSTVIRGQLPMTPAVRTVQAEVTIGTDRRMLAFSPGGSR